MTPMNITTPTQARMATARRGTSQRRRRLICAVADWSWSSVPSVCDERPRSTSCCRSNSPSISVLTPRSLRSAPCSLRRSSSCPDSRRCVRASEMAAGCEKTERERERK